MLAHLFSYAFGVTGNIYFHINSPNAEIADVIMASASLDFSDEPKKIVCEEVEVNDQLKEKSIVCQENFVQQNSRESPLKNLKFSEIKSEEVKKDG